MTLKVLITTTSFLETPGEHRELLERAPFQLCSARGPLSSEELLKLIREQGPFDGVLAGEDNFSSEVLEALAPQTKVISRYGVGFDRVDLDAAARLGIVVTNTPGANHISVAEHTFGLMLSMARSIPDHAQAVQRCEWKRWSGRELYGKTLGIVGFGRVGQEVSRRALAFGMNVAVFNTSWSTHHTEFVEKCAQFFDNKWLSPDGVKIERYTAIEELLGVSHFVSLHMNLTRDNTRFLNARLLNCCKRGAMIVNVSRGGLVDQRALANSIRGGYIGGYAADVLDPEPVTSDNPLLGLSRVYLTPHIGSRTQESVARQGTLAFENLNRVLSGEPALHQVNVRR